jgi:hypothetical protein
VGFGANCPGKPLLMMRRRMLMMMVIFFLNVCYCFYYVYSYYYILSLYYDYCYSHLRISDKREGLISCLETKQFAPNYVWVGISVEEMEHGIRQDIFLKIGIFLL